jgi:hypothetical protein
MVVQFKPVDGCLIIWINGAASDQCQALQLIASMRAAVRARGPDGDYWDFSESAVQHAAEILRKGLQNGEITLQLEEQN